MIRPGNYRFYAEPRDIENLQERQKEELEQNRYTLEKKLETNYGNALGELYLSGAKRKQEHCQRIDQNTAQQFNVLDQHYHNQVSEFLSQVTEKRQECEAICNQSLSRYYLHNQNDGIEADLSSTTIQDGNVLNQAVFYDARKEEHVAGDYGAFDGNGTLNAPLPGTSMLPPNLYYDPALGSGQPTLLSRDPTEVPLQATLRPEVQDFTTRYIDAFLAASYDLLGNGEKIETVVQDLFRKKCGVVTPKSLWAITPTVANSMIPISSVANAFREFIYSFSVVVLMQVVHNNKHDGVTPEISPRSTSIIPETVRSIFDYQLQSVEASCLVLMERRGNDLKLDQNQFAVLWRKFAEAVYQSVNDYSLQRLVEKEEKMRSEMASYQVLSDELVSEVNRLNAKIEELEIRIQNVTPRTPSVKCETPRHDHESPRTPRDYYVDDTFGRSPDNLDSRLKTQHNSSNPMDLSFGQSLDRQQPDQNKSDQHKLLDQVVDWLMSGVGVPNLIPDLSQSQDEPGSLASATEMQSDVLGLLGRAVPSVVAASSALPSSAAHSAAQSQVPLSSAAPVSVSAANHESNPNLPSKIHPPKIPKTHTKTLADLLEVDEKCVAVADILKARSPNTSTSPRTVSPAEPSKGVIKNNDGQNSENGAQVGIPSSGGKKQVLQKQATFDSKEPSIKEYDVPRLSAAEGRNSGISGARLSGLSIDTDQKSQSSMITVESTRNFFKYYHLIRSLGSGTFGKCELVLDKKKFLRDQEKNKVKSGSLGHGSGSEFPNSKISRLGESSDSDDENGSGTGSSTDLTGHSLYAPKSKKKNSKDKLASSGPAWQAVHFEQQENSKRRQLSERHYRVAKIISKANIDTENTSGVNVIAKNSGQEEQLRRTALMAEFDILRKLDHPHIIRTYECLEDRYNFYFILDYAFGGNLRSFMQDTLYSSFFANRGQLYVDESAHTVEEHLDLVDDDSLSAESVLQSVPGLPTPANKGLLKRLKMKAIEGLVHGHSRKAMLDSLAHTIENPDASDSSDNEPSVSSNLRGSGHFKSNIFESHRGKKKKSAFSPDSSAAMKLQQKIAAAKLTKSGGSAAGTRTPLSKSSLGKARSPYISAMDRLSIRNIGALSFNGGLTPEVLLRTPRTPSLEASAASVGKQQGEDGTLISDSQIKDKTISGAGTGSRELLQSSGSGQFSAFDSVIEDMLDDPQIFFFFDVIEDIFLQLFSAISYMHERDIIHRDIKPANILIMTPKDQYPIHICVCDFGLAKYFEQNEPQIQKESVNVDKFSALSADPKESKEKDNGLIASIKSQTHHRIEENVGNIVASQKQDDMLVVGTFQYMAPEVFGRRTTQKSDIWSIGVILYEVIFGRKPYDFDDNIFGLYYQLTTTNPDFGDAKTQDNPTVVLCKKLLEKDPHKRPTAYEAMRTEWLYEKWQEKRFPIHAFTTKGKTEKVAEELTSLNTHYVDSLDYYMCMLVLAAAFNHCPIGSFASLNSFCLSRDAKAVPFEFFVQSLQVSCGVTVEVARAIGQALEESLQARPISLEPNTSTSQASVIPEDPAKKLDGGLQSTISDTPTTEVSFVRFCGFGMHFLRVVTRKFLRAAFDKLVVSKGMMSDSGGVCLSLYDATNLVRSISIANITALASPTTTVLSATSSPGITIVDTLTATVEEPVISSSNEKTDVLLKLLLETPGGTLIHSEVEKNFDAVFLEILIAKNFRLILPESVESVLEGRQVFSYQELENCILPLVFRTSMSPDDQSPCRTKTAAESLATNSTWRSDKCGFVLRRTSGSASIIAQRDSRGKLHKLISDMCSVTSGRLPTLLQAFQRWIGPTRALAQRDSRSSNCDRIGGANISSSPMATSLKRRASTEKLPAMNTNPLNWNRVETPVSDAGNYVQVVAPAAGSDMLANQIARSNSLSTSLQSWRKQNMDSSSASSSENVSRNVSGNISGSASASVSGSGSVGSGGGVPGDSASAQCPNEDESLKRRIRSILKKDSDIGFSKNRVLLCLEEECIETGNIRRIRAPSIIFGHELESEVLRNVVPTRTSLASIESGSSSAEEKTDSNSSPSGYKSSSTPENIQRGSGESSSSAVVTESPGPSPSSGPCPGPSTKKGRGKKEKSSLSLEMSSGSEDDGKRKEGKTPEQHQDKSSTSGTKVESSAWASKIENPVTTDSVELGSQPSASPDSARAATAVGVSPLRQRLSSVSSSSSLLSAELNQRRMDKDARATYQEIRQASIEALIRSASQSIDEILSSSTLSRKSLDKKLSDAKLSETLEGDDDDDLGTSGKLARRINEKLEIAKTENAAISPLMSMNPETGLQMSQETTPILPLSNSSSLAASLNQASGNPLQSSGKYQSAPASQRAPMGSQIELMTLPGPSKGKKKGKKAMSLMIEVGGDDGDGSGDDRAIHAQGSQELSAPNLTGSQLSGSQQLSGSSSMSTIKASLALRNAGVSSLSQQLSVNRVPFVQKQLSVNRVSSINAQNLRQANSAPVAVPATKKGKGKKNLALIIAGDSSGSDRNNRTNQKETPQQQPPQNPNPTSTKPSEGVTSGALPKKGKGKKRFSITVDISDREDADRSSNDPNGNDLNRNHMNSNDLDRNHIQRIGDDIQNQHEKAASGTGSVTMRRHPSLGEIMLAEIEQEWKSQKKIMNSL